MKFSQLLDFGARHLASCVAKHVLCLLVASSLALSMPVGNPSPIIGPDVISFGSLQPVTIIYHPLAIVQPQIGLPAPEGSVFEGPDPGLNANIIGGTDCPNNYRKDRAGICRLEFVYGPHPFSAIIPKTFKGSLQFYMGLQVGNYNPFPRRRIPPRLRGRQRNRNASRRFSNINNRQKEEKESKKQPTDHNKQDQKEQEENQIQQEQEQSQQTTTPSSDDDDD